MRSSVSSRSYFSVLLIIAGAFLSSCGEPVNRPNASPEPTVAPSTKPSPSPQSSPANHVAVSQTGFSVDSVCTIPRDIAGTTAFGDLGGGSWQKWGDSDGELDYGCDGGKESVKLEQQTARISATYGAFGGAQTISYVYVRYKALQYGGVAPIEKTLRQQYVDFCDRLSESFYGRKLSESARKRLGDDSTYSTAEKPKSYEEKIGNGFVLLATRKEAAGMTTLDARFFPGEAEFKKFKDSE